MTLNTSQRGFENLYGNMLTRNHRQGKDTELNKLLEEVLGKKKCRQKHGYNSMTRITNTILSPSIPNPQYKIYLNGRLPQP